MLEQQNFFAKNEINKDFQNTLKTWEEIKEKALDSNAPSLVYEEGDIIKRTLRDVYDNETFNIYLQGNVTVAPSKNNLLYERINAKIC